MQSRDAVAEKRDRDSGMRSLFLSRIRMYGLDMIYAPDAPLSYECQYTSETEENQQRSLQRSGCGVHWWPCNRNASILQSAQHPTRIDNATCTNVPIFSAIGGHVQCTNKNNHEIRLLLAARFELADPTACFKFKPSAPNNTGCAARERHIMGKLVQYR